MATVAQVAKAALQKILVQASESALEPSEYQDFIFTMNNFMLDLDAGGVSLGYTEVSNLGDTVTIPPGALQGLIYNTALLCAPEYDGEVTPTLMRIAHESLKTMRKLGRSIPTSSYPGTLSIGSGNEGNFNYRNSHFFNDQEAAILAETTGSIGLESSTNEQ